MSVIVSFRQEVNIGFLESTALRNHNRIVFEEMSSWIALTMHLGMKDTFFIKYIKANMFGILL